MMRPRSVWLRVLHLYDSDDDTPDAAGLLVEDSIVEARVHARSRFRSLVDPRRLAHYSVHNAEDALALAPLAPPDGRDGAHTLIAVREFRRVPLDASSLALTVFTARPGRAVPVVATLAHFVERAVDVYQPAYLLLAHSLEEPRTSLLLTAVQDSLALGAAAPAAFSLDELLIELDPLLQEPPESYAYCPEAAAASIAGPVSPYAV
jgi:hypothetical protein